MSKPAILFDSHCKLCNAEIEYYKKHDPEKIFAYVDIMHPDFDAPIYHLTKSDVHKYFHVIDDKGKILKGVEGFNYIWKRLSKFKLLQYVYRTSIGKGLMNLGYEGFVKARPFLPRKKNCDDYCEI